MYCVLEWEPGEQKAGASCWVLWCKGSHSGWFQATNVMAPGADLGRDVNGQLSRANMSNFSPTLGGWHPPMGLQGVATSLRLAPKVGGEEPKCRGISVIKEEESFREEEEAVHVLCWPVA